jgi:hypothetical protein
VAFIGGAVTFVEGAVTFVEGAVTFVEGAVTFVGEGGSAVGGSFKTAGVRVDNVGVNKRDLRQRLITYELKGPSLSINSLISASNHSVGSSSWATSYSACGTDLLFLLKTHTPLRRSSCLSLLIADLLASLNICTSKLLKSSWYNSYRLLSLKLHLVYLLILKSI